MKRLGIGNTREEGEGNPIWIPKRELRCVVITNLHGRAVTNEVQYQNTSITPSLSSAIISWISHCAINPTQNTNKLGVQAQKPKVVGNG